MRMHDRLTVVLGDIANQREQLHLLLQIDRCLILLCFRVEPREPHGGERANSLEARIRTVVLRRKVLEPFCKLIPGIENKHIAFSVDLSPSHRVAPAVLDFAFETEAVVTNFALRLSQSSGRSVAVTLLDIVLKALT